MGEELIYKLVDFLETASPMLWEAAVRQSIVNAWVNVLWFVVLTIATSATVRASIGCLHRREEHPYDDWGEMAAVGGIVSIIVALIALMTLVNAIKSGLNPTYYAIKNLIDLVPGS